MAKFDVIITCSGLGTRLLPYTNYLNKSLIKIGDQPAISHILNMYPSDTKFIITLGYLSDHIKDYLSIVHSDKDITYVYVDNYNGPGSSLLYSLSKTFPLINKPFVFNACDTIVHNMNCKFNKENIALATTSTFDNQYRKFNKYIEDHPATYGEDCYIGLCYINDYQKFISIANSLLLTQCDNLSDAHVLQKLDIKKKIILQSDWIDIGNHASLSKARNKFNNKICVLEKENEETYYDNDKIIKFFSSTNKVNKLYSRYLELKDCTPEIHCLNNFLYYDFIKGDVLSKTIIADNFIDFLEWCKKTLWINFINNENTEEFYRNFYEIKAKDRVKKYLDRFGDALNIKKINFRDTENINVLLKKLSESNLDSKKHCLFCRTHGDLVFENVIKNSNYILIDWREEFYNGFGDLYYDLAKMKHNLIFDHEVIKNKKFIINEENHEVIFDPSIPYKNFELIQLFDSWCAKNHFDLDTIDLKVALIQLSSSGLHLHDDAKLLFYMGWYNLQRILKNYEQST